MAKLKNIIRQLSETDFENIFNTLMESSAEKSAFLLKYMYKEKVSDTKIMSLLNVNSNAYYTLRSRLNQKIEEYLLEQVESPRTDILKKVANINEILFTKNRAIIIATLKKLEKELLDYDLPNELTVVYKNLKRLHINHPDHFTYSQLYNKHVAYTLSLDKAENLLSQYFAKFGEYTFTQDETTLLELNLLNNELNITRQQYESHRVYVYYACVNIFHRLFTIDGQSDGEEPIEDMIRNVKEIFTNYNLDAIYHHIKIIFELLSLEYYNHYNVYRKMEDFYEEVNDSISSLLTNYTLFTYPTRFLFTKLERALRTNTEKELYKENEVLFMDYQSDQNDIYTAISYTCYRAISCFYVKEYKEAAKWLNQLLNELSLKKYPIINIELKLLLASQYVMMNDNDLYSQLLSSVQRQIRIVGKDKCPALYLLYKALKTIISNKSNRFDKFEELIDEWKATPKRLFAPSQYLKFDI